MRLLFLGIFTFYAWAFPALAEEFVFQDGGDVSVYKVASNSFTAVVRHPFRVVKLAGKNLRGTISFNPDAIDKGISYAFELDVAELDEPEGPLAGAVAAILGSPKIKFSGNSVTVVTPAKTPGEPFRAVLRPRVEIGERVSYPEFRIHASRDGKIFRWEIQSQFTLTEFSIPLPKRWGIPAEDKVVVEGEVSFAPKE